MWRQDRRTSLLPHGMNIAVFFHTLFYPERYLFNSFTIVTEQVEQMRQSGLLDACSEMIVGCNGGEESRDVAHLLLPEKSKIVYHGLESKSENLTIVEIEKWVPQHPNWCVLYFHAKGISHDPESIDGRLRTKWRVCMMKHLVEGWQQCVHYLTTGYEAVGCHWMDGADHTQHIFGGNFWWASSNYLSTLPSIYKRDRIKVSGIASAESRYEAEVWLGNGSRLPRVKDCVNHGFLDCPPV